MFNATHNDEDLTLLLSIILDPDWAKERVVILDNDSLDEYESKVVKCTDKVVELTKLELMRYFEIALNKLSYLSTNKEVNIIKDKVWLEVAKY